MLLAALVSLGSRDARATKGGPAEDVQARRAELVAALEAEDGLAISSRGVRALDACGAWWLGAALEAHEAEAVLARDTLLGLEKLVLPWADAHADWELAARALAWHPAPPPPSAWPAFARAVRASPSWFLAKQLPREVTRALGLREPPRPTPSERVGREHMAGERSPEAIFADQQSDLQEWQEAATRLASRDPENLPAVIVPVARQLEPSFLRVLTGSSRPWPILWPAYAVSPQTLVQVDRLVARNTGHPRLGVLQASLHWAAGLYADAEREATLVLAQSVVPADVAGAARLVQKLSRVGLGDSDALGQGVSLVSVAARSPFLRQWLASFSGASQEKLRQELAVLELASRAHPSWERETSLEALLRGAPGDELEQRLVTEAADLPDAGIFVRTCRDDHLSAHACFLRLRAVQHLRYLATSDDDDDDDDEEGADGIPWDPSWGKEPGVALAGWLARLGRSWRPAWLSGIRRLPAEALVSFKRWPTEVVPPAIMRTAPGERFAFGVALAGDELTVAADRLSRAEHLSPAEHLLFSLILDARRAGAIDAKTAVAWSSAAHDHDDELAPSGEALGGAGGAEASDGDDGDDNEDWIRQQYGGKNQAAALLRGLAHLRAGHPREALTDLRELAEIWRTGAAKEEVWRKEARAFVAALVYLAAARAGDEPARKAAANVALSSAPVGGAALRVAAEEARRAENVDETRRLSLALLVASPGNRAAASSLLLWSLAQGRDELVPRAKDVAGRAARALTELRPLAVALPVEEGEQPAWSSRCSRALWLSQALEESTRWLDFPEDCPLARAAEAELISPFQLRSLLAQAKTTADVLRVARLGLSLPAVRDAAWWAYVAGDARLAAREMASRESDGRSGDQVLRLLLGRGRAVFSKESKQALWRRDVFLLDGSNEQRMTAFANGAGGAAKQQIRCLRLRYGPAAAERFEACAAAWKDRQGRAPEVAEALLESALSDPAKAAREGILPKELIAEAHATFGATPSPSFLLLESTWWTESGDAEKAARLREEAWSLGAGHSQGGLDKTALAAVIHAPLLARYQIAKRGEDAGLSALAFAALLAGDARLSARYAQASLRRAPREGETVTSAWFNLDLAALAQPDLDRGELDAAGLAGAVLTLTSQSHHEQLASLLARYPRARALQLLQCERAAGKGSVSAQQRAFLQQLAHELPGNGLVVADAVGVLSAAGERAVAAELLARARQLSPGDHFLERAQLASPVSPAASSAPTVIAPAPGADSSSDLPAGLRSPKERAAALAARPASTLPEPNLVRETGPHGEYDYLLPADFEKDDSRPGERSFQRKGVVVGVNVVPRMTRCLGLACLDVLLPNLEARGLRTRWRRPASFRFGSGAEALLSGPNGLLTIAAVPAGSVVEVIFMAAPGATLNAEVALTRLVYETFRPRHLVQPQHIVDRLDPWPPPPDRLRLARELASQANGPGCPLASLFAGPLASDSDRLVLDTFLTTVWDSTREKLLACDPGGDLATLTLVGLWDADRTVRQRAMAHVPGHEGALLAEARKLIDVDRPLDASELEGSSDRRWLQLHAALSPGGRAKLQAAWRASRLPHLKFLASLVGRWQEAPLERALVEAVKVGPPSEARLAAKAAGWEHAEIREAAKERMRRTGAAPSEEELAFLVTAARGLGGTADPEAAVVLRELAARLGKAGKHAAAARSLGQASEAIPRTGVAMQGPAARPTRTPAMLTSADLTRLDKPLSELLASGRWSYLEIAHPDRAFLRIGQAVRRMEARGPSFSQAATEVTHRAFSRVAAWESRLAGLDLSRPMACATSPAFGHVACAAWRDLRSASVPVEATRALQELSQGLVLTVAPASVGILPFFGHEAWTRPEIAGEGRAGSILVHEAFDETLAEAPVMVKRFASVDVDVKGNGSLNEDLVLLTPTRAFYFDSVATLMNVLGEGSFASVRATLADEPGFRTRRAKASKDAELLLLSPSDGPKGESSWDLMELASSQDDWETRWQMATWPEEREAPVAALQTSRAKRIAPEALLPEGAALTFASTDARALFRNLPEQAASREPPLGPSPPVWVASAATDFAFGWYPQGRGALWADWMGVARWDEGLERSWREHGYRVLVDDDVPTTLAPGLLAVKKGELVLFGPGTSLLAVAVNRWSKVAPGPQVPGFHATFDGARTAAALADLASRAPNPFLNAWIGLLATMSSRVVRGETRAAYDPAGRELAGRSRLVPIPSSVPPRAEMAWSELDVSHNFLELPRNLDGELVEKVELTVEAERGVDMESLWAHNGRQQTSKIGNDRWLLRVKAGPRPDQPAPQTSLSVADHVRFTDVSGLGMTVVNTARGLAVASSKRSVAAETANAILRWEQSHLVYEVTPQLFTPEAVLIRGRGDCTEYADLAVALFRARGIPAQVRYGFLADGRHMLAHAWVAFHDGSAWREMDPANGRASVDARYTEAAGLEPLALAYQRRLRVLDMRADVAP